MFETAQRFEHCRAKIDALAERHLRDLGIDPAEMQLDPAGLTELLREEDSEPRS
jgi:hypothetical protein